MYYKLKINKILLGRQMPILLSEAFTAMLTMITGATFYALLITNAVASKVSSQCSRQLYDDKVRYGSKCMGYMGRNHQPWGRQPFSTEKGGNAFLDKEFFQPFKNINKENQYFRVVFQNLSVMNLSKSKLSSAEFSKFETAPI